LLASHYPETEILAFQSVMMTTDLSELSSSELPENSEARTDTRDNAGRSTRERTESGVFARGVFAPVIPMSMSYRRARTWAARMRAGRLDAQRLELMRAMERKNLG
jgi:hypothetical protein